MVTSQLCSESCSFPQTSVADNWKANRCPNRLSQLVSFHCHYMHGTGGSAQVLESDISGFFIPALPLVSLVTVGKLLNFSEVQVP